MKTENIALFKRFLHSEGANTLFFGMYKQCHPKERPDDVEEFLREVDAKDAVLEAFRFPDAGIDFGLDYWFEKAVKWENCLRTATTSQFYAYCWHNKEQIAREAAKPLERVTAYLHPVGAVGQSLFTLGHDNVPKDYIESLHKDKSDTPTAEIKKEKLDAWVGKSFQKKEPKPQKSISLASGVSEEQMALSGFTLFKIRETKRTKLLDGFISINIKSGYRVCFNQTVSKEIIAAGHTYLHVFSKEGTLYFLFDDSSSDGLKWRINENNVVFSHKDLIMNIRAFFNIKEERTELAISNNMAKTYKNLFYKITKTK